MKRNPEKATHLNAEARAFLMRSDFERKMMIEADRFVKYDLADQILKHLNEKLLVTEHVRKNRPIGATIIADAGNGKSSILNMFQQLHPPHRRLDGTVCVRIVTIEPPRGAKVLDLYRLVLRQLAAAGNTKDELRLQEQIKDLFESLGVLMLVIDEFHNTLNANGKPRGDLLDALKWFNNDLKVPIVVAGVDLVRDALKKDGYDQMITRSEPIELPRWDHNDAFLELLDALEASLPLWKPSKLADDQRAVSLILQRGSKRIGGMWEFLSRCAKVAIDSGEEKITYDMLKTTPFVPPDDRGEGSLF